MKEAMRLRIGHYIVRATHSKSLRMVMGGGGVFGIPPFMTTFVGVPCQWGFART